MAFLTREVFTEIAKRLWVDVKSKIDTSVERSKADWSVNDPNDPSYVAGRTHWEVYTSGIDYTFSNLVFTEYGENYDGQMIYTANGTDENLAIEYDGSYEIEWPEFLAGCIAQYCDGYGLDYSYNNKLFLGNIGLITDSGYNSGEPFLIIIGDGGEYEIYTAANDVTEFSFNAESHTVHPLDEMYIPDSIARTDRVSMIEEMVGDTPVADQINAAIANVDVQDEVYIGSGEMPEGYTIQIDPTGDAAVLASMPYPTAENAGKALTVNDNGDFVLDVKPATAAFYNTTIPIEGWTDTAPYSIELPIDGMLASDIPLVDIVQSGTEDTDALIREAWTVITRVVAADNAIVVYAAEEIPTVEIPIHMVVIR